ncbi:MAG: hypothetical protein AB7O97_16130 [Planctomycetota bacterium]
MQAEPGKVRGRLLLVANLAAATGAAGTYAVGFLQPGLVGVTAPAGLGFDGRFVLLPLDTPVAFLVLALALALLLCNFAWLVRRAPAPAPRTYVHSETPSGPVRVAREALEAGLQKSGEALPEITRLRVHVDCAQPKRILVSGHFQCAEGTSNLNASQRLRAVLRDRFAEMVRLQDGARVDYELEFQGFFGKLAKKAVEPQVALEPEPPPFTGPQYPIDDDEDGGHR